MNKKGQPTETSQSTIPITIGKNTYNVVLSITSGRIEQERDELRDVLEQLSLYLSVGMGDETTTAKQYKERILEGIKMLTDPLMNRIQEAEKKLDLQTKIVVDLEKRLMQ